MNPARLAVVLAHPLAAIFLIWMFFRQRRWRQQSSVLKGEERRDSVYDHESKGDKIAIASIGIVLLAFASNAARGVIDHGDATSYLVPGFHGLTGLMGLTMMLYLWRLGRRTKEKRESGEGFARTKEMHGKISDLLGILVIIHAFLGFLYLLNIL